MSLFIIISRQRKLDVVSYVLLLLCIIRSSEASCKRSCGLAIASYNVWLGANLTFISNILTKDISEILRYNPDIQNPDSVQSDTLVNVPFSCDCINGDFFGHTFAYKIQSGDTYDNIARITFANLTTADWVQKVNYYDPTRIPDFALINVTVNCSCGNGDVSKQYGLFATYPLRTGDNLLSVAAESNISAPLLQRRAILIAFHVEQDRYIQKGSGKLIFRDFISYHFHGVAIVLFMAACLYAGISRRKMVEEESLILSAPKDYFFQHEHELAKATNDFNLSHKIGQGGFGTVYYAELRGEKAAIKKMDMQASKEFLAELKVLTHVHHLNLVRLIGYCVEGSLFLVYEYIENGNLNQHLHGNGLEPLSWSARVQIALDSARGLEYIHEHTVPMYIHRDIKSPNILIDKNFHGKVADFGLTKLTEVGNASLQTRLVGTFGYMPPEYAQYGDISPKVDVYAFGVVLYELISAKEAVVKTNEFTAESKGLVALFEDALSQPEDTKDLCKLVDTRLGDNYPIDSVRKMAQLAKACTQENPQLRPSMRSIVVALMTLSSTTEDWDVGSFYENQALVNLMSGR
ncbi:hypothetical protein GIB67_032713 [Kingdonia uniflora]|uniref:non-specific serine/threonine protein kinase n=1 Tax=Kingdonia uniflora TaxID=39325 RepID=A0A7J7MW47_9MAGN|nr:hypothetical protein GIB67_032713 [Kingdonia uniflora]